MLLFVQDAVAQSEPLDPKVPLTSPSAPLKVRVEAYRALSELARAFSADSLMALGSGKVRVMVQAGSDSEPWHTLRLSDE